jgi:hypothetical protein
MSLNSLKPMAGIWLSQKAVTGKKHPTKPGRVTIAGHPSHDLTPGALNSILKQAQVKKPKCGER